MLHNPLPTQEPFPPVLGHLHVLLTCFSQQMHNVLTTMLSSSQQSIGQVDPLQGASEH